MGESGNSTETSSKDITLWRLLTLSFDTLKSGQFQNVSQKQGSGECPVGVYFFARLRYACIAIGALFALLMVGGWHNVV